MKILYIATQRPWPLTVGSRIRSHHIVNGLARNHDVTIALVTDNPEEGQTPEDEGWTSWPLHMLTREAASFAGSLPSRLWARYRMVMAPAHRDVYRKSLLDLISEVRPDVTWYYQSPSIWMAGHTSDIPCVFDMDDLESRKYARHAGYRPLFERLVIRADMPAFLHAERAVIRRAQALLVSNPDDRALVAGRTNAPVMVMPNGADFPERLDIPLRSGKRILFFGCITYGPCADGIAWFCDEVWPQIIKRAQDATLDIIGAYPEELRRLSGLPGVTLHGFVEDLEPLVRQSAFLVVPLRIAGGTRVKILEAWSKGLPVVSTSIGCEGLGAVDGVHLLRADTPQDLAEKCLKLLESPDLARDLAAQGFDHGKRNFDWEGLYPTLEAALTAAVNLSF